MQIINELSTSDIFERYFYILIQLYFLSRGCVIKVLQPQWLANEIKRLHQEAAKLYE